MASWMIFAEASAGWWQTYSEFILWAAGLLAALSVIAKMPVLNRPLLWLWRHLISDPIGGWMRKSVAVVVEDKISTGPLRERMDATATMVLENHEYTKEVLGNWQESKDNQIHLLAKIDNIHECLDRRFTESHARLAKLTEFTEEVLAEATGAKERIRQIYRALDIAVFETNAEGLCTYVNPAYSATTGLSYDQSLGEGWMEAIDPGDRERLHRSWNNAVHATIDFNAIFRVKNTTTGNVTEVRGSASPLHDGLKQIVGWVGTLDPIDRSSSSVGSTTSAPEDPHA